MKTVVYIDSVFLLNAATDYLLLLITARLAGLALRRGRYLCAACAGGLYAAAAWLPGWAFLTAAPVKCAAGVGVCLIAFGSEERLGRLTLLFFTVSCALAGGVVATDLLTGATGADPTSFLSAALGAWALLAVFFRAAAQYHASGKLLSVGVCIGGRVAELTALYDSGNSLTDAGRPALVVSAEAAPRIFPPPLASRLTPDALRSPPDSLILVMERMPSLRPRLLPYRAVGVPSGLLLSVESDWAEIGGTRYPGLRLALSPTALGDGYQALWGGEVGEIARDGNIGKGARYGDGSNNAGTGAASAGTARRRPSLYRRQRHPAAAVEPGTGGGTAGTYDGTGGKAGTD